MSSKRLTTALSASSIVSPSPTTGSSRVIKRIYAFKNETISNAARCHNLYALALGRY